VPSHEYLVRTEDIYTYTYLYTVLTISCKARGFYWR